MRRGSASLILLAAVACPAVAADLDCKRLPIDPQLPAGIAGKYQVVGKPKNGVAYSGRVDLTIGKTEYRIVRTLQGKSQEGAAWPIECGMDKIRSLAVRIDTKPALHMTCTLGADGDNYYRMTCRSRDGVETWIQQE